MEQTCITCGAPFNYFQQSATVICDKNHVVCKACAKELIRSRSKCPYCLGDINVSEYSIGQQSIQPQQWQPQPQYQPQYHQPYQPYGQVQQGHGQGQIVGAPINVGRPVVEAYGQPRYQVGAQPIVVVGPKRNPNKFCVFSVLFLVLAIVFLVNRIRMSQCQYWYAYSCYGLCCLTSSSCTSTYYNNCYSISYFQNSSSVVLYTILIVVNAILSITFMTCFIRRRQARTAQLQYAQLQH